ncbi:MAG: hypothetical protein KTR20_09485 [Cellvibrionaceae bacterium]|nr:hypothetical protein [Cellvibrionaceae bacterium]
MTDDILADIFRHNTAIHVSDMFDDPDFNNPVTVGYCPLLLQQKSNAFDFSNSNIPEETTNYLSKAEKDLKEFVNDYGGKLGDKAESLYNAALANIVDNYNAIMQKGHTVGIVGEASGSFGVGGIGGVIKAFDKNGSSTFGFIGLTAGATVGLSAAGGAIYHPGLRQGLQGWGGNFNASFTAGWFGAQWEATMTNGKSGHLVKYAVGGEFALSVELAKTWLIKNMAY